MTTSSIERNLSVPESPSPTSTSVSAAARDRGDEREVLLANGADVELARRRGHPCQRGSHCHGRLGLALLCPIETHRIDQGHDVGPQIGRFEAALLEGGDDLFHALVDPREPGGPAFALPEALQQRARGETVDFA